MNLQAKEKLINARTSLLLNHFFWGKLALYLIMVERTDTPTLEVDGKHIFYNPQFVLDLSMDLTKSGIVHEIGHCMFNSDMVSRSTNRHNQRAWVRSVRMLGRQWLLAQPIALTRKEA